MIVWCIIYFSGYYNALTSVAFVVPSGDGRSIYKCVKLLKRSETFLLTGSFLKSLWFTTGNQGPQESPKPTTAETTSQWQADAEPWVLWPFLNSVSLHFPHLAQPQLHFSRKKKQTVCHGRTTGEKKMFCHPFFFPPSFIQHYARS